MLRLKFTFCYEGRAAQKSLTARRNSTWNLYGIREVLIGGDLKDALFASGCGRVVEGLLRNSIRNLQDACEIPTRLLH